MKIVCIVPARGGSKRIVNKNIKELWGEPLIFYTLNEAVKCKLINKIFVTTESERIKKIVHEFNSNNKVSVGIINRPSELATEFSTTESTLIHAINKLYSVGIVMDYILILPPTSPFRKVMHINNLINLVIKYNANSGQTISELVNRIGRFENNYFEYDEASKCIEMHRLKKRYIENSAAYLFKPEILLNTGRMQDRLNLGMLMQKPYDLDINDMIDWYFAEFLIKNGIV